jgi:hypothetical protein
MSQFDIWILDDDIPPNDLFILILAGTCDVLFCSGKGTMILFQSDFLVKKETVLKSIKVSDRKQ